MREASRPTRRDLLASVASTGIAALAGCGVCAYSVADVDDYLRIAVPRIEPAGDGIRGRAAVIHRGEDNWDWGFDRERFFATYEGVVLRAFGATGEEVLTIPVGDLEPGSTVERSFRVDAFPLVFYATAEDIEVDDDVDTDCLAHRTGSHVASYVGTVVEEKRDVEDRDDEGGEGSDAAESEVDDEDGGGGRDAGGAGDSPCRTDNGRTLGFADGIDGCWREATDLPAGRYVEYVGADGGSWLVVDERERSGRPAVTSDYLVYLTKCLHRLIDEAESDGAQRRDLSLVPDAESWLRRGAEFSISLYERIRADEDVRSTAAPAAGGHELLRELYRSTGWDRGRRWIEEPVSEETWFKVLEALDPMMDPVGGWFLSCHEDHVRCRSDDYATPDGCSTSIQAAYYEVQIADGEPSGVILKYGDGPGPPPPRTVDELAGKDDAESEADG